MLNQIEFEIIGDLALFTNPISKLRGEKMSYPLPTHSAMVGVLDSIFRTPKMKWFVDEIRVMNEIRFIHKSVNPIVEINSKEVGDEYKITHSPSVYTYIYKPHYKVKAHFEMSSDCSYEENARNYNRTLRALKRGGSYPIFLGTSECNAFIFPCKFSEGNSFYDNTEELPFELMVHSIIYPTEIIESQTHVCFWEPVMRNSVVKLIAAENCSQVFPLTNNYVFKKTS